jgi:hypothetical protein
MPQTFDVEHVLANISEQDKIALLSGKTEAMNFGNGIPLGPSVARIEGTLNSGIGCVCQKSIPAFVNG